MLRYEAFAGDRQEEPASLTMTELEVISLVAQGNSAKEIARTMTLSPRMVERHIEVCRHKLGAKNTAQLVAKMISSGQ